MHRIRPGVMGVSCSGEAARNNLHEEVQRDIEELKAEGFASSSVSPEQSQEQRQYQYARANAKGTAAPSTETVPSKYGSPVHEREMRERDGGGDGDGVSAADSPQAVVAAAAAVAAPDPTPAISTSGKPRCRICHEDSYVKRDQLVPCSGCGQQFHTACFGANRIPFTMKSHEERINRDRYVARR